MKGQDVLILLKGLADGSASHDALAKRPYRDLGWELGMSASEVLAGVRRLQASTLLKPDRSVSAAAAREFLIHGLKYAFPAAPGPESLGVRTGLHAPPLAGEHRIRLDGAPWVWPTPSGDSRGPSLSPLYGSAPVAAGRDADLHAWLAVVDCLRVGRARERRFAQKWIERKLGAVK